MPKVSVIIPVYNGERYIEQALDSVFRQTFEDYEVIVVNDGSTDGTERRLEKYRDRIRYVKQENRGLAATRQRGLGVSSSPVVAFLDADDLWLPKKLERQVEFAQAHPEYGIITTDVLSFENERIVCCSLKEWYQVSTGFVMENLLFGNWIPPSAAMIRRECFEEVSTFDVPPPAYGEDWMMWIQISARYPVYFIDEVLVRRRLHPDSMSSRGDEVQFRCLFRNFEILRKKVPHLRERPHLVKEASFRICFRRGVRDLQALHLTGAREKLRSALSYKPLSVEAWAFLGLAYLPARLLRWTKEAVRARRSGAPG